MLGKRLINTKVAGGGGGCTDIVDNYDPFGGNGVALYQLNGNATDVSGNYNGTATNVTYGTGVFGQAGVFNGSSSIIKNGNLGVAFRGQNELTISLWVKTSGHSSSTQINNLVSFSNTNDPSTELDIWFRGSSGNVIKIENRDDGVNSISCENSNSIADNQWHNIVFTADSSGTKLYLDGAQETLSFAIGDSSTQIVMPNDLNQFNIGANQDSGGVQWHADAEIDQVRIFNTALTPLEVEALYTEELCICDGTVDTLDILGDGSCIATYQLDGNANDLSGNYSGTPTNVSYGVGEFDLAGVFNGSSSKVDLPAITTANLNTISFWFKSTDTGASKQIFSMGNSGSYNWLNVRLNQGKIEAGYGSNDGAYLIGSSTTTNSTFNDGNWHHAVCVFTGVYGINQTPNIFIDGQDVASSSAAESGLPHSTTGGGAIGYYNPQNILYFNGSIDQVRIFNKALSAGEVTTLYNETACTKPACTGTTNTLDILGDGSCIAAYPLDGSPADLSGNYNGVQTDVTYPQGYFDLAGSFNGSSSRVVTPITSNFSNVSVSCWVNFNAFGGGDSTLIHKGFYISSDNSQYIHLRYEAYGNNRLTFWIRNNNTYNTGAISNVSISTGVWYHVVGTYDSSGTAKIYVNGVKGIDATGGPTITNSNAWRMGSQRDSANDLNGSLDQVRIFNKALSASEITTLYNETPCN